MLALNNSKRTENLRSLSQSKLPIFSFLAFNSGRSGVRWVGPNQLWIRRSKRKKQNLSIISNDFCASGPEVLGKQKKHDWIVSGEKKVGTLSKHCHSDRYGTGLFSYLQTECALFVLFQIVLLLQKKGFDNATAFTFSLSLSLSFNDLHLTWLILKAN